MSTKRKSLVNYWLLLAGHYSNFLCLFQGYQKAFLVVMADKVYEIKVQYPIAGDEKAKSNTVSSEQWDPSLLITELYGKITAESMQEKRRATLKEKQVSVMQGYLDKLPVNQLKPKPFKGWKKRWFKIQRGKIFYYEHNKSETPFGSLHLVGASVSSRDDGRSIQIISKTNGNTLMLRCNSETECTDWMTALKRVSTIEATVVDSVEDAKGEKNETIIIDLGASCTRAGLVSSKSPDIAFPTVFSVKLYNDNGRRFTATGMPDPHFCRCGFEALDPENRKSAKLVYPMKPTMTVDKYLIKSRYVPGIFEKVFHDLALDANGKTLIISCPRNLRDKDKELMLDYLFGQLHVHAVYMQQQALLSLYAHNITTGVIVDIGDHIDVIPVVDGVPLEAGSASLPYGGQQITEFLGKLLTESGYRFFSDLEVYAVRYIKECVAQVSLNCEEDMETCDNIAVYLDKFNLPGGQKVVHVGNHRYRCVEGLFNPNLWGKDNIPLQEMVRNAIMACDIHERRDLCKNIYITGGTSLIPGLAARLKEELVKVFPESVNMTVSASSYGQNAAFHGACVMSSLSSFSGQLITNEEWSDSGVKVLEKWNI